MVKVDRKWALAACVMVLVIWGNSLVPGTGSGSLSLSIMESVRGFLQALGLPYEWVTNFVVRKCAHFTEYMVLGILATHAFDIEGRRSFDVLLPMMETDSAAFLSQDAAVWQENIDWLQSTGMIDSTFDPAEVMVDLLG